MEKGIATPMHEVKGKGLPFIAKAMVAAYRLPYMGDLTPEENERLRQRMMTALQTRFKNVTDLASAIGRSQPSISDFLNAKGGASIETVRRFASAMGTSVEDVLGHAGVTSVSLPSRALEYDDQYPNRARAVVAARALGYTEEAIAQVQGQHFAGQPDMEPEEWLDEIKTADRRLRRGVAPVGTVVASDLDVEPPGFEEEKPLPKRGKGKK
jgi:transcriptional regulator with XRE-family HTH domain